MFQILINALRETMLMVMYASIFSFLLGIPLGMLIANMAEAQSRLAKTTFNALKGFLQFGGTIPYLVIMLALIPCTNWLLNHKISFTTATILPLTIAGTMMLAHHVAQQLIASQNKWQNTIKALGATKKQALLLILLPESLEAIIKAAANTAAAIVGYSFIAGAFGAGGLGQLAIEKTIGEPNFLYACISISTLVALQQIFKYTPLLIIKHK